MKKAQKQALISFAILIAVFGFSEEILPNSLEWIVFLATSVSLIIYAIYDSKTQANDE